jgi:hypothetical protein
MASRVDVVVPLSWTNGDREPLEKFCLAIAPTIKARPGKEGRFSKDYSYSVVRDLFEKWVNENL